MAGIHCIHFRCHFVPCCLVPGSQPRHCSLCVHDDSPAIPLPVFSLFSVHSKLSPRLQPFQYPPRHLFSSIIHVTKKLPMYLWAVSPLECIVNDSRMKCLGWIAFYFLFMHRVWVMKEAPLKMNSRKKLMMVRLLELKVLTEIWIVSLTDCSIFC